MNYKFRFLFFFIILTLSNSHIYTQSKEWVSISNQYISISMDIKTGRYIVYDAVKNNTPIDIETSFFPNSFLKYTSPIPLNDKNLSPFLGSSTNALNVTTISIDEMPVVFGSENGRWISPPVIQNNIIIYGWAIGGLEIIQTIAIVTNTETLFPDAVQITYDIINKDTTKYRKVAARLILDPTLGDNQNNAFYLPNYETINTEYTATLESLPEYWLTSDQTGELSSSSLKGFLQNQHPIKPRRIYLTTIDQALRDIWEYKYSKYSTINNKDNAVVLFFDPQSVAPNSSIRIASTMIGLPTLIDVFGNNGLEVRTSSFTSQKTTPLSIDLWLQNTNVAVFDEVTLEIKAPPTLDVFDPIIKKITAIGYKNKKPISWSISPKEQKGDSYDIVIDVKGYQNGIVTSQFNVPITINVDDQFENNNNKNLLDTIDQTKKTIQQLTPISKQNNTLTLSQFNPGDTSGKNNTSLSKIYNYLQKNNSIENKQIIKMIETEQVLIQEIFDLEKNILDINKQYNILLGIYERMYKDSSKIDRDQINVQLLIDNISTFEEKIKQQESMISNITSSSDK